MKKGRIGLLLALGVVAAPVCRGAGGSRVDELVFARLRELNIPPSEVCTDEVFVRRLYLDLLGTLPTAREARRFLEDARPGKRAALVERLFEREEFADYWTMKWCDILRVKAEFPSKLWPNAVQTYTRWLRDAIQSNLPYDRFARALLTSSGSNFRVAPVNFYRAVQKREPESIAATVALTFMGTRTAGWTPARREGMGAFFALVGYKKTSEWKEEVVYFDLPRALKEYGDGQSLQGVFPDGGSVELDVNRDPRVVFAEWLTAPENPWFARNIVNRVWCWLLGRGLIHEPDDLRPDNPCQNPALLAWLEQELVQHAFDLQHIYRLILNSNTYQLACIPATENPAAEANFAHYQVRRLEAEVLIDALNQITGSTDSYSSQIPEPFTFIPAHHRAVALSDGSISSSFLDMFGRPPRDTGLAVERNNEPSDSQRLHLLNSSHIQRKMQNSKRLRGLLKSSKQPAVVVRRLYLNVLSRFPTPEEQRIALDYYAATPGWKMHAATDLTWALINSKEFLYRH